MKTYIWNTEYSVLVTVAESDFDARKSLITQAGVQFVNDVIANDPNGLVREARCYDRMKNLMEVLDVLKGPASHILEQGKSLIYDHANE